MGKIIQKPNPENGIVQAIFTYLTLRLWVQVSDRGVRSIRNAGSDGGQMVLFSELEYRLTDRNVPFGVSLQEDLDRAMTGELNCPNTPLDPPGPRWYRDLYHDLWRLAPGTETDPPALFPVGKGHKDRQEIFKAIASCRLWPLVPLHRVRPPANESWKFPFGEDWRRHLLDKESNHKKTIP